MQRETRLSAIRKRRDLALSTLLACRQASTAIRVLVVDDVEDEEEEVMKQLTRRSRSNSSSGLRTEACGSLGFAPATSLEYPSLYHGQ
jgi:hypothetical protein